jgi:general L-amino acid transport system substrate-binding protein
MRFLSIVLVLLSICWPLSSATAGSVLERVKSNGVVDCGSVQRPGLAGRDAHGRWIGLEVDVCRAVAAAVLASPDKIRYHVYETAKNFDALRNGQDDLSFLTGSEIAEQKLAGKVLPGPTVFIEFHSVMVPENAASQHVDDLAGDSICYVIGSPVERSLEAYFSTAGKGWIHRAFSEDSEMADTYLAQNCHAIAGEITTLAAIRKGPGIIHLTSRILPETLAAFPVMAVTGTADAQWAGIVAWTVHTLVSAERPQTKWYAGNAGAMPVSATELGLDQGWQQRVLNSVGNYGAIYKRNLGRDSSLRIDRGLNANQINGGLLLSPFLE